MASVLSPVDKNRGNFVQIIPCCVVLALSKANSSGETSVIYGMAENKDGDIEGNPSPVCKRNGRYIWENKMIEKENIRFGSVLKYKESKGLFIYEGNTRIKKGIDEIQMNLVYGINAYRGIKEACPDVKFGENRGMYIFKENQPQNPRCFLVALRYGVIANERLYFGTRNGEHGNLKLNCRENLTLSTAPVFLQMKPVTDDDDVGDVALIRFSTTESNYLGNPVYQAVCEGLILKYHPKVISTDEEPVKIQNGDGVFIDVPGSVKVDTGNDVATGISKELMEKLDLEPDNSKRMRFVTAGGGSAECARVKIKVKIRRHVFPVNALVGGPARGTNLLIGQDIIKKLNDEKFAVGE